MLIFSMSSTIMAVITTSLLLILLALCLINNDILVRAGYRLLAFFVLFTVFRFVVPLEFPFTTNVKLPAIISRLMAKSRHTLFTIGNYRVSLWRIFLWIWLIGAIYSIIRYIVSYYCAHYYITLNGKELTASTPYAETIAQICTELNRPNHFRVIELPGIASPALFGIFSPRILIPENVQLKGQPLYYVLRHEMAHHFHHDLILKNIIKIITLVYWWNPFGILLNRQTDIILEMRVDDSLTQANVEQTSAYMHCLLDYITDNMEKAPLPSHFTMGMWLTKQSDLSKRFQLMTNNQQKRNILVTLTMLVIAFCIYVSSYMFIFEAYTVPNEIISSDSPNAEYIFFPASDPFYLIDRGDGTYDVYSNDEFLENTDSIEYYPPGTPIYTPDTVPIVQ
ncbi:MAG: M56 family metallopeptidase [Lachnospiraceae bacterium]|nr:M56 family metallopeptidase [Lachnospiraceae bacterium]